MLIEKIRLNGLLSFGSDARFLRLEPLNVLIGPNGSGKSNFIEVIGLLQAAPRDFAAAISEGGGVRDWLWNGEDNHPKANIMIKLPPIFSEKYSVYKISFESTALSTLNIIDESITVTADRALSKRLKVIMDKIRELKLDKKEIDSQQSIFSRHKLLHEDIQEPFLGIIDNLLQRIKIYRNCAIGQPLTALPQRADLPNDFLLEDCSNLGLVLNQFNMDPAAKSRLLESLRQLYENITDFVVKVEGGTVQVFMQEGQSRPIPATRLSDGTLRYLCLLTILCHPKPPPLICIEEPELGLHPDIMPILADLLVEASKRTQLIVTTHSEILVDALSETPESVIVCEKHDNQTSMKRLDGDKLAKWLKDYSLGNLWTSGEIGGNRW